jgi:predicted nucleotidyltransferase
MDAVARERVFAAARDALWAAVPDAWALYAYGSFARAEEWPQSDLDLAVLLPPRHVITDRSGLAHRISRDVGREVDLVELRRAGLDLIREVLRDGRALRVAAESDTLAWEAEQMTAYADFNPRRSALVSMYLKEPLLEKP